MQILAEAGLGNCRPTWVYFLALISALGEIRFSRELVLSHTRRAWLACETAERLTDPATAQGCIKYSNMTAASPLWGPVIRSIVEAGEPRPTDSGHGCGPGAHRA
jgi:hypothetical protein